MSNKAITPVVVKVPRSELARFHPAKRLIIDVVPIDPPTDGPRSHRRDRWANRWRGFGRQETWPTKKLAVSAALVDAYDHEALGGWASVVVHGKDGKIQEERTFPRLSDPRHRPG